MYIAGAVATYQSAAKWKVRSLYVHLLLKNEMHSFTNPIPPSHIFSWIGQDAATITDVFLFTIHHIKTRAGVMHADDVFALACASILNSEGASIGLDRGALCCIS